MTGRPASMAEQIEARQRARIAKQATYHAKRLAYYERAGEPEKAAESAEWLRTNVRCRCCGRALTNAESKASGIGPECRKRAA